MLEHDIATINAQLAEQRRIGRGETHFYRYGPAPSGGILHLGNLKWVFLEEEINSDLAKLIPSFYKKAEKDLPMPFLFQLSEIKSDPLAIEEIKNMLICPGIVFMDVVSFVSPRMILEAEPRCFFGQEAPSAE